jgi:hypothetical protein
MRHSKSFSGCQPGEIFLAHLLAGLKNPGEDGRQVGQGRVIIHGKEIPVRVVLHLAHPGQLQQSGAHRVGAARSDEAALRHHARNLK